jgi:hypothetical protein
VVIKGVVFNFVIFKISQNLYEENKKKSKVFPIFVKMNADLATWTCQLSSVHSVIWQSELNNQVKWILQNSQIVTWTIWQSGIGK